MVDYKATVNFSVSGSIILPESPKFQAAHRPNSFRSDTSLSSGFYTASVLDTCIPPTSSNLPVSDKGPKATGDLSEQESFKEALDPRPDKKSIIFYRETYTKSALEEPSPEIETVSAAGDSVFDLNSLDDVPAASTVESAAKDSVNSVWSTDTPTLEPTGQFSR